MYKKILFVGAGASFGARITNTPKLPIGANLLPWLIEKCDEILKCPELMIYFSVVNEVTLQ